MSAEVKKTTKSKVAPVKKSSAKKPEMKKPKTVKTVVKKSKMPVEDKQKLYSPLIEKITVNIGVGEAGDRLKKAESVIESLTKHAPIQTLSKITSKDWSLRKQMPIGCKVTLRGKDANDFLVEALTTRENKIADYGFDKEGNLSFGVPDHTLFKSQKYDPKIGIFGMDVCITMKKHGYRVKRRRIASRKIPHRHRVTKDESVKFFKETFNVEVI